MKRTTTTIYCDRCGERIASDNGANGEASWANTSGFGYPGKGVKIKATKEVRPSHSDLFQTTFVPVITPVSKLIFNDSKLYLCPSCLEAVLEDALEQVRSLKPGSDEGV